jgi:phage terminase small subunit
MTRDLIHVPRNAGPKMQQLPDQWQRFVMAMIETGGNRVRSALLAGFGAKSGTPDQRYRAAAMTGSRLAHDERITEAIQEQAERMMKAGAIKAAAVMIELMDSPDPKVRQKAASETLAISGIQGVAKQEIKVEHTDKTTGELLAFIRSAAKDQGLDPRKLLGSVGVDPSILDAEFTEVPKDTDTLSETAETSTEGLEDLL